VLLWLAALPALGIAMSRWVDANKYSLNGVYRNRLVRAYLGASRGDARSGTAERPGTADRFTGFDHRDSPKLAELFQPTKGPARLFHVVNMALNLVHGDNLAWQQRKAQSFTASPLHCGSGESRGADGRRTGGYRRSLFYADGGGRRPDLARPLSLGTAMAISGAAASPNMGYHSSPAVSFLMTLLNVRLGAWLGNPGLPGDGTYRDHAPRLSVQALWDEALGRTHDRSKYVYLSDGGLFENLGLY
jgi:hypothetical protein